jgi:hypothetical protein
MCSLIKCLSFHNTRFRFNYINRLIVHLIYKKKKGIIPSVPNDIQGNIYSDKLMPCPTWNSNCYQVRFIPQFSSAVKPTMNKYIHISQINHY